MATYWVSTLGDNSDGTTYAKAKTTLAAGVALLTTKGDILNVVNDADHTWPIAETDIPAGTTGTSFADYGTLIRGTDVDGNPALATIKSVGANAARLFVRVVADTGYIILRNLKFDASDHTGDASSYYACRLRDTGSPNPGPVRVEGCILIGGATGVAAGGVRRLFSIHTTPPPAGSEVLQIEDCYFQNCNGIVIDAGATLDKSIVGCVFYNDVPATAGDLFYSQILAAGTGGILTFSNNTIYQSITSGGGLAGQITYQVAAGLNAGTVTVQDNLVFLESSAGSPNIAFMADGGPGDGSATDTIDYNVLLGGPSVVVGDLHAEGWYHDLWALSAVANDQYAYEQAEADIFVDTSTTYAWDALNNSVTLTILKDLRLKEYTTASSVSGVVGALPAGETDYTIEIARDTANPDAGDSVQLVLTLSNSGESATDITVSAPIPSGLTYVSHVEASGTYSTSTDIWTVASLASGASTTLTINVSVDDDQDGNTITVTATITGSDPAQDPDTSDNTDSTTITVTDADDPLDDTQPAAQPYLDVRPIYGDDLKLDLNVRFSIIKNRINQIYKRRDYEGQIYREFSARRIVLATNTTMELNLGGIQTGEFFVMEATTAVDVSAVKEDTQRYFPGLTALVIGGGDFERIHLKNNSTTLTSSIMTGAVD
jgi:uncharacterized repeat protein (TIGR01451 family)